MSTGAEAVSPRLLYVSQKEDTENKLMWSGNIKKIEYCCNSIDFY